MQRPPAIPGNVTNSRSRGTNGIDARVGVPQEDDLRSRRLLEGNMDVYQWFLMISSHSQRHILQIREIKAHPKFPG